MDEVFKTKLSKTLNILKDNTVLVICGNSRLAKITFLEEICKITGTKIMNSKSINFEIDRLVKENKKVAIDEAEDFIRRNKNNEIPDHFYILCLKENDIDSHSLIETLIMIDHIFVKKDRVHLVCI